MDLTRIADNATNKKLAAMNEEFNEEMMKRARLRLEEEKRRLRNVATTA